MHEVTEILSSSERAGGRVAASAWPAVRTFSLAFALLVGAARAAESAPGPGGVPSELGLPVVQNFLARDIPTGSAFFAGVADEDGQLYFCNRGWIVSYNSVEWKRFRPTE